jgi:hypothetical protein
MAVKIEQRLEVFTPIICRLMARKTHARTAKLMTDAEIIKRMEARHWPHALPLMWQATWNGVPIDLALDYMKACGIDLNDGVGMDKHAKYLRRRPAWLHLKRDDEWKSRWLKMLLQQQGYNTTYGK